MKTVKLGSTGLEVRILQHFFDLSVTGTFNASLKAVVTSYQKKKNLSADGIVGKQAWAAITAEAITIKSGSKGKWVRIWQEIIEATVDGVFGAKTKAKTKTYQAANGLTQDGIVGKNTWAKAFAVATTSGATTNTTTTGTNTTKPVDYKQYDSKWAKVVYTQNNTYDRSQTIKSSGCGPTSAADVVATFWDKSITPVELAAYSVSRGYRTKNSGTSWSFFKDVAQKFGASKFIQTSSYATAAAAVNDGALVVVSVKKSRWTNGGHFICWWKVDSKYVYIADPASSSSSRAKAPWSELKEAAKQYFIFYK